MFVRACFSAVLILGCVANSSALGEICRWIDRGQTHRWNDKANWQNGHIPGSDDRFVSTPYYAMRPDWGLYRVLIDSTVWAECNNAKNMNQLVMDIVGGSFTVYNEWKIGQDNGQGAVINMSGGSVYVGGYVDLGGWAEGQSMGTLNMTGGVFTIIGVLKMGCFDATRSYLNLDGGTVSVGSLQFGGARAVIDITEGVLTLAGDQRGSVEYYVNSGHIRAYGGEVDVLYDYGETKPGWTTVRAIPEPATAVLLVLGVLVVSRRKRS